MAEFVWIELLWMLFGQNEPEWSLAESRVPGLGEKLGPVRSCFA